MERTIDVTGYTTVMTHICDGNAVASSVRIAEDEMKAQSNLLVIKNVA